MGCCRVCVCDFPNCLPRNFHLAYFSVVDYLFGESQLPYYRIFSQPYGDIYMGKNHIISPITNANLPGI